MDVKVRKTIKEDREAIRSMLLETMVFNQEEIDCALELVGIYLNNPSQKDYQIVSALNGDDRAVGYICYGKTPLTNGVYDIYWIAVRPEYQSNGIGKILLKYVKNEIAKVSGRMLIAETSSRAAYDKTRKFYTKNGFLEEAKIKNFYSSGDDKITYINIIHC